MLIHLAIIFGDCLKKFITKFGEIRERFREGLTVLSRWKSRIYSVQVELQYRSNILEIAKVQEIINIISFLFFSTENDSKPLTL